MPLQFHEMDHSLLEITETPLPYTPLERARICAQVFGPNIQDNVFQAVQGDYEDIERNSHLAKKNGINDPYKLFSWMSYTFAHGDPNCGNYFTWAGLTFEGNLPFFRSFASKFNIILADYFPLRMPIHPELQKILEYGGYTTHFSSIRIPHISGGDKEIRLSWPGILSRTVGSAPKSVKWKILQTYTKESVQA